MDPTDVRHSDNAAMIGWASMHRFLAEDVDEYTVDILPKWSIEDISEGKPLCEKKWISHP